MQKCHKMKGIVILVNAEILGGRVWRKLKIIEAEQRFKSHLWKTDWQEIQTFSYRTENVYNVSLSGRCSSTTPAPCFRKLEIAKEYEAWWMSNTHALVWKSRFVQLRQLSACLDYENVESKVLTVRHREGALNVGDCTCRKNWRYDIARIRLDWSTV